MATNTPAHIHAYAQLAPAEWKGHTGSNRSREWPSSAEGKTDMKTHINWQNKRDKQKNRNHNEVSLTQDIFFIQQSRKLAFREMPPTSWQPRLTCMSAWSLVHNAVMDQTTHDIGVVYNSLWKDSQWTGRRSILSLVIKKTKLQYKLAHKPGSVASAWCHHKSRSTPR